MSKWKGRNVLVIGDSITAAMCWQREFARITGANVRTHALGGIGLIDMVYGFGAEGSRTLTYNPEGWELGKLDPLSEEEVAWSNLIIILGPYNNRGLVYGKRGDMYPNDDSLTGRFNLILDRIYSLMDSTGNFDCHLMLCAPHCVGKYQWCDRDGYEDCPEGSGRSLETMADCIGDVAKSHNIHFCNCWQDSGIGRHNWKYYCFSPDVKNPDYDPNTDYGCPYPEYADQAHLNEFGYRRLGDCIASASELA